MYVRSVATYIEHSAVCLQLVMPVTMGLRLVRLRVYQSVHDERGDSKAHPSRRFGPQRERCHVQEPARCR